MQIAGLQKNSTIDFPGCLAAVVFTAGCNFRCFYCHNRGILNDPPLLAEAAVSAFLEKRAGLLSGVVFSGGEPTLQKDLAWWLNKAKKLGYQTKLDTNGSRPAVLASVLQAGLVDYVAMDYKAPPARYEDICLASATGVMESLALLRASGVAYELRTTVVPQLDLAALTAMARDIPHERWALQLYRPQPGDEAFLRGVPPYTPARLAAFADALAPLCPGVFPR